MKWSVAGRGSQVDHYRTLGVARDATTREIRRAYWRLARRHHPDANPGDDDPGRFVAITGAYQVLSDPAARARYDRTLSATRSPSPRPRPAARHRVGILELSLAEAAHLTHRALVLTDGSTTIRLPAGLGHGDTIALDDDGSVTVLHIRVKT